MTAGGPPGQTALPPEPQLREAAIALHDGRLDAAEFALRDFLQTSPRNPNALRMLAEVAIRANCLADAEGLLERCIDIAPQFFAARYRYAWLLFRMNKAHRASEEIERLLLEQPDNFECLSLKSVVLARIGDYAGALALHERLLREHPERPGLWLNHAAALKAAGRSTDSIAAYHAAIARFPHLVEAYWGLGNTKTYRFDASELSQMHSELARPDLSETDRCLLHFTLGKAAEDGGEYASAFEHYAKANAIRRAQNPYDADETSRLFGRIRAIFTRDFLASRAGSGSPARDPIFVLGLPRSGSTLVEQILASHSEVEATMELLNVNALLERLDGPYPEVLAGLDAEVFEALGEEYIEETRPFRNRGRTFFIDKMPENFRHVGLIHLMLPNAKIVDARRHPLACGVSNWRQDFEADYAFTYDLADLGRYYGDYVRLMAHWDEVLPGKVHRLVHERLLDDPRGEVERLLAFLGLPFDEACLRFYENTRPVLTASAEQVRRPLYKSEVEQWRNFEPWLGPLKQALGEALESWST
ncbi:MAG: sulfotransferase [Alphaproteobacteria bacterium]|nr:sulfotransferase [Alphaproteobacteria bacterium]MBV9692422.1 sulfotransferase [Alphaproteobacteria bacterium]